MATGDIIVVGYLFPPKKIAKMKTILDRKANQIEFKQLDLAILRQLAESTVNRQPFDMLLHKLAHDMVFAKVNSDADAIEKLQLVNKIMKKYPEICIVDDLDSVEVLTDREKCCQVLQQIVQLQPTKAKLFEVPNYAAFNVNSDQIEEKILHCGLQFPIICKSIEACGTQGSHWMALLGQSSDISTLSGKCGGRLVFQDFINHSAVLYKGYVMGDTVYIASRVSIPNLDAGRMKALEFDTQKTYPTAPDLHVSQVIETSFLLSPEQVKGQMQEIAKILRSHFHLSLFGFDVILREDTQELYIVDVNYFPSFKELPNLDSALRQHLVATYFKKKVEKKTSL